jgi:integrase/recombinase XerC
MADKMVLRAFADYLEHHPKRYARATVVRRVAVTRTFLAAFPRWRTVKPLEVERWVADLGVGPSTTRDYVSHVRAFYRWAIRAERTDRDPTATVDLPRAPRRLPRPASEVAIARAVSAAGRAELVAMLALMAGAGLRALEVAGLRWSDVDLVAGTIHVTGKFDRERVIDIGPPIRRALAAIDAPGKQVHVFISPHTGRPYRPARISHLVCNHLRAVAAGCVGHQLRHRFATRALADCGNLSIVRDLLGHSTVATTEGYAAVTPGAGAAVSRSIDVPGLA